MRFEKLDFHDDKLLHLQIADIIEQKIISKEIPVGEKLPPEETWYETFKVSIPTLRKALSILADKGYLSRRRSYGTFVTSCKPKDSIDLKKNNVICFVTCTGSTRLTFESPYYYGFINGAQEGVKEHGLHLLTKNLSENDTDLDFEEKEKGIAGLVIAGNITPAHIRVIKKRQKPYVLIGDVLQKGVDNSVDVITGDDFQAIYLATEYLISLGHRRIVYLSQYFDRYPWDIEAIKGYRKALGDYGVSCDNKLVLEVGSSSVNDIYSVMKGFLDKKIAFTALIFPDLPSLYLGTMRAFRKKNIRVPEDVSLIATDKFPGMTKVVFNNEEIGKAAAQRLIERLTNPDRKPERIIIPHKLYPGDTTRQLNAATSV